MRSPDAGSLVWLDGRIVSVERATIPIFDSGFLAGLGLFETLAVRDGRAVDLEAHIDRLAFGAKRIQIILPAPAILREASRHVAESLPRPRAWLKIVASSGGHAAVFGGAAAASEEGRPCSAILLPWIRSRSDALCGLKTLNYAPFALGLEEAARRGADEGLWRNERGHLVEACTANLFVVKNRRLFTPAPADGILPGVVRALALRAAREASLIVHEGKLRLKRLLRSDEAFLTSSVRGVRPLVSFEGRPVGSGKPGPLTREIAERVDSLRATDPETDDSAPLVPGISETAGPD